MENEIEDTEFRLKRGSDLGRFDQFWDDESLFRCRYSQSKWFYLKPHSTVPLEIYSHALKGNKNIIHITLDGFHSDSDSDLVRILTTICDSPWVTSISWFKPLPAIHRGVLFIKSINNDLTTFAKEIRPKLDPDSTYIFTDAGRSDMQLHSGYLIHDARVLISFVAPTSGQSLILRLKHSGEDDALLEVALGSSTIIQLNPSSKLPLTIDDISLHPISGPSESDHLSFKPGIRNEIVIRFRGTVDSKEQGHVLHDVELLDEAGLVWRMRES
jgi:hypothetical protein